MTTDTRRHLQAWLIRLEGLKRHAYRDHLGYLTIGVGRLIDERRGGGLTHSECLYLLDHDLNDRIAGLVTRQPVMLELDEARQAVLVNMAFQLGVAGTMGFKQMWKALERRDYEGAASAMLASKWAREDTPARAQEEAAIMRSGRLP